MKECNCFACQQQKEYESSITGMYEMPIYKCINQKEMKTKILKYKGEVVTPMCNIDTGMYIRESDKVVLYLTPNDIKEVAVPKQHKRGDYVIGYVGNAKYISIYDVCYVYVDSLDKEVMYAPFGFATVKDATIYDMSMLFSALEKEGKYWDSGTLEVKELSINSRIDGILFNLRNCSESVADVREKIKDIINKEVNKAVNEIYK